MSGCDARGGRGFITGFALSLVLAALAACQPTRHWQQRHLFYFGTEIDVQIYAGSAKGEQVFNQLDSAFKGWHQRWHAWQPSELTALNDGLQAGTAMPVAPDLAGLIKRSQQLSLQSEGLFDPALGQRIKAWGFARDDMTSAAPAAPALDPARLPAMTDLFWQADLLSRSPSNLLSSRHPDLRLDLGGIAKGYALNAVRKQLQQAGIEHALVNLGGDVLGLGQRGGRPWRIAVQAPAGGEALAAFELHTGELAFTSGVYARKHALSVASANAEPATTGNAASAHHIIDPRTGAPAEGNLAVTVLGRDGELLQAASKALLIAGADWPRLASRMGIAEAIVVRADQEVQISPLAAKRLAQIAPLPAQFTVTELPPH